MKKERKNLAPVPKRFFARKPKVYVKNSKKTCVCFSVDIDASNYTLAEKNLLFDILFEGEFCKIHQELSEKKGYVYSYDPCFQHYNNIGQMTLMKCCQSIFMICGDGCRSVEVHERGHNR